MSPDDAMARRRWGMLVLTRLVAMAGAVFGLILAARAHGTAPKVLGVAILVSALVVMAVVPAALAHRWRSPR